MPQEVSIKNLEEIDHKALHGSEHSELCHVYAIMKREDARQTALIWHLMDEYKELPVHLVGKHEEYPRPKPGDVVRIHRLRINTKMKRAEITMGRNVVYWPAFQYEPKPVTTAKNPTMIEEDNIRRRQLETLYSNKVTRCSDILRASSASNLSWFQAVAGRVETIQTDQFGHIEMKFTDGTEPPTTNPGKQPLRPTLKVYKPTPQEHAAHYETAKSMIKGQYFVATNLKLSFNLNLHLSANEQYGRSLRLVDNASIIGVKLRESLGDTQVNQRASSSSSQPVRRSPRLNKDPQDDQTSDPTSQLDNSTTVDVALSPAPTNPRQVEIPKFHRYNEITPRETGYDFYDLIGQVRGQPTLTKQYGNCALQIFDGSRHNHASFYADEFEQTIPGCLVLYVYSKQAPHDTNEHFERAMSLQPGDIIHIRNVKISLRDGRLKVELQANKLHNKSINPIDVNSHFGQKVLDIVQTPQVAEIYDEDTSDSSQENRFDSS